MKSLKTLLKFAMAKEEEAAAFYELLAASATASNVREVFLDFSRQEQAHKKIFEGIVKKGCTLKTAKGSQAEASLQLSEHLVDVPYDPSMSYQDVLILGMKREEKSAALYRDLSRRVDDSCLAETLERMAKEEDRHKGRLEDLYEKEVLTED